MTPVLNASALQIMMTGTVKPMKTRSLSMNTNHEKAVTAEKLVETMDHALVQAGFGEAASSN